MQHTLHAADRELRWDQIRHKLLLFARQLATSRAQQQRAFAARGLLGAVASDLVRLVVPAPGEAYALVFGAVLCEAAYAVIGKALTGVLGPKRITSLINLWGFALSTPMGLYVALQFDFGSVPAPMWLLLVFYALAACVWTVWLWMTGLKVVPAAQGGVFTVLLPISAALVGVLVLGESLDKVQFLALAVALAGVLLATLPRRVPH